MFNLFSVLLFSIYYLLLILEGVPHIDDNKDEVYEDDPFADTDIVSYDNYDIDFV